MTKLNRLGIITMFLVLCGLSIKLPFSKTSDFIIFVVLLFFGIICMIPGKDDKKPP
jgi:hypothetical protein